MAKKKYYDAMSGSNNSGMISENKSAVANLPQEVMYKAWPATDFGLSSNLNDTITGINEQMRDDAKGARRQMKPTKY